MKTRLPISRQRPANARGITLIECLVYIALVMIVLGLATVAFYRCFDNMKALRRNADDITTTLHAGELWRTDVRAATGPIKFDDNEQVLHIPRSDREVAYKFSETQILRRANANAPWVVVLPRVVKSQMQTDVRPQVTAWRWELELQTLRQPATIRPLFTFTAVPSAQIQP